MKPYTYLLIDLACFAIPFIASFYPKFPFYKEWKYFFPACLLVAMFFLCWDYYFTEIGIWGFNPEYLTGHYFGNLPIEEMLFFISIPYACVFTYFSLKSLVSISESNNAHKVISIILIASFSLLALIFINRLYTAATFVLTSLFLLFSLYKKINFNYIYLAYLVILPFFFISNGILTGSLLEAPIVWYNDLENMGIRMITIPIEDTFYGFLLVGMNIVLYRRFKSIAY